jgi:hypothetical protein
MCNLTDYNHIRSAATRQVNSVGLDNRLGYTTCPVAAFLIPPKATY